VHGPNDLAVDGLRRIRLTDPRRAGREPVEPDAYGVYRLDPDESLERVLAREGRPNGIALSLDGGTLWLAIFAPGERRLVGRSPPRRIPIERWTVGRRGAPGEGPLFVDCDAQDGADGLGSDREGHFGRRFGGVIGRGPTASIPRATSAPICRDRRPRTSPSAARPRMTCCGSPEIAASGACGSARRGIMCGDDRLGRVPAPSGRRMDRRPELG
jgi:hypothetical protein